jgi:hypothetical protein
MAVNEAVVFAVKTVTEVAWRERGRLQSLAAFGPKIESSTSKRKNVRF